MRDQEAEAPKLMLSDLLEKGLSQRVLFGIIWFAQHNLWWVYTSLQSEVMCMNFSFSDIIVFAAFIVALLTYIDRKKK
ncbi:hypothetical protein CPT76_24320 [Paenibacillus sp. AR247]|nr:hypothetical protein CPT76_24320 [Paenibacillus sp. AR247]